MWVLPEEDGVDGIIYVDRVTSRWQWKREMTLERYIPKGLCCANLKPVSKDHDFDEASQILQVGVI